VKRFFLAAFVVLAAACSERTTTQYVGTVMSEAEPDHEGSLRLTFFARTDTSFSGVIELGLPMRGSGTIYAWHEGSEFHMVSVGAETGDTIRWFSRLTDAGLGGRYEVTGGQRTGQQGTWRATLMQGLPATPATLRSPSAVPLPPPLSFWPVLLFVAIAIGLGRWIRAAPRAQSTDRAALRASSSPLSGIGGWLALFALGRVVAIVVTLKQTGSSWRDYAGSAGIGAAVNGLGPLILLETVVAFVSLPLALGGLILLLRRSPYAPRFFFAFLVFNAVFPLGDAFAMSFIEPGLKRLVGADALANKDVNSRLSALIRQAAFSLIWALYWVKSKRVRATFGAGALDSAVTAPVGVSPFAAASLPNEPPAEKRRRWRRLTVRSLVAVLAVIVALVAYGLWSMHVTPYSVPEGADIRATVAGRWAWESDTAGCQRAHTIAFAEGGKVMTITSGEIGATDPVTTYDILSASRSTIRGAIRGEKRMTDRGTPVVWDLVLTSPDDYRWKRTDWSATPWSYTGSIRRCPAGAAVTAVER
jgi:hypothetical protein